MNQSELNNIQTAIPFSYGRILMMGIFSIVLCISFLLSIFTPYPIGLASVLFGRAKGIALAVVSTCAFFMIYSQSQTEYTLFYYYVFAVILAVILAEIVRNSLNPIKSLGVLSGAVLLLLFAGLSTVLSEQNKTIKEVLIVKIESQKEAFDKIQEQLKTQNDQKSFENQALLSNPEAMATMVIQRLPSLIIFSILIMLWINLFLLLKSHRLINRSEEAKYTEKDLTNFSLPEICVIGVVISIALQMFGESYGWWVPVLGTAILSLLGTFYLFVGFGIYFDFLDHFKIKGFFRTLLIVLTFFTAPLMILVALLGLFDTFINFRKFLKKNTNSDLK